MWNTITSALSAGLLAFMIGVGSLPQVILLLKKMSIGQMIQSDGPAHHEKSNTPTMAGLWLIILWIGVCAFWLDWWNPYQAIPVFVAVGFMLLGLIDDLAKILHKDNNQGLSVRMKFFGQFVLAGIAVSWWMSTVNHSAATVIQFPPLFLGGGGIDIGLFYPVFAVLVIVGSSNSVNLTDGLDGLVSVPTILVALGLMLAIGHYHSVVPQAVLQDAILLHALPGITVMLAVLSGVFLAFLVYNCYPAEVFLGDTGSLSVGALLAVVALLLKLEVYFAVMSGLFVLEALSVMVQVGVYKCYKKRVLLMAPFHHHFEKKGWHENKVVVRLWIAAVIFLLLSYCLMPIY